MTQPSIEDFFNNTGGGVGAPSARLSAVDDFVFGVVVDQALVDKKKFGKDEIEKDERTGEPIKQLVVILQTDLRNWSGVAKIPTNEDGSQRAQSEDDGRRAVYVAPFTNIHAAIGDAIVEANGAKGPIANGATLGVKVVELKDTGKGNPLKIHAAKYVAPVASDGGFFGGDQPAAPAATPAPQEQPAATPPAPNVAPPTPATDPWGAPTTQSDAGGPPF